jgi:predicted RNase H-like nuclease (RuvC/YqgF family)
MALENNSDRYSHEIHKLNERITFIQDKVIEFKSKATKLKNKAMDEKNPVRAVKFNNKAGEYEQVINYLTMRIRQWQNYIKIYNNNLKKNKDIDIEYDVECPGGPINI